MEYDMVIRNGRVIDGTGNPWFRADIGIIKGKIRVVGPLRGVITRKEIDAQDLVVCPGFIDIHTHSDLSLLINPKAESKVRQGVTTEVVGNCGTSAAPVDKSHLEYLKELWESEAAEVGWSWSTVGEYLTKLQEQGIAPNVATFVGHGTVRAAVIGLERRSPSVIELTRMKQLVAHSMRDGAFGMSSGLVYLPGSFATTSELTELCKVVSEYGGFYTSHIRGEREGIVDALNEAVEIAEKAGTPLEVSHNCPKYGGHGKFEEMSLIYEAARRRGVELTIDNDAHTDFNPKMSQVLPQWAQAGGNDAVVERLSDAATRELIVREIVQDVSPGPGYAGLVKHGEWDRIFLLKATRNADLIGGSIRDIAKSRGQDPFNTYLDLIIEERGEATALFNYIEDEDIRALLRHPLMMVCSDGVAVAPYGALGKIQGYWPCSYGEYPYILERFVREEAVLTLQEAIRKMTSLPAQKLGLRDRGQIREGMWADIVVFDPDAIKDHATCRFPYSFPLDNYPHRYPEGIHYVIVNGETVVAGKDHLGVLPGHVLRHRWNRPRNGAV